MYLIRFIKSIILIIILIGPQGVRAQLLQSADFAPPLSVPLFLSGNFGELRSNHLHTGLDFKTNGIIGQNVYATTNGYVSRIKVEPGGFGNTIYITHPNGYTSLYAHLLCFRRDLDSVCKLYQYKANRFEVDVKLQPFDFKVKCGDFIAISGNSGGSMGPHLHFEIRETSTQKPVNIQKIAKFLISDTVAPILKGIFIYPVDSLSFVNGMSDPQHFKIEPHGSSYKLAGADAVRVHGKIAFGAEIVDLMNYSTSKLGVYSVELFVDKQLVFRQRMDMLDYSHSRAVNSLIDYSYYIKSKVRVNRMFIEPNNNLPIYTTAPNRGVVLVDNGFEKLVRIRLTDINLNSTEVLFKLKPDLSAPKPAVKSPKGRWETKRFYYNQSNSFVNSQINLTVTALALFNDFTFKYQMLDGGNGYYSPIHYLANEDVPILKSATVKIKPTGLPPKLFSKALLMRINSDGKPEWYGGSYSNGYVVASIRSFGRYVVVADTVSPSIEPLFTNFGSLNFNDWDRISFKVKDDQSGISYFQGKVDGVWALFEYDEKYDVLSYSFDKQRMANKPDHILELLVVDKMGNMAVYCKTFTKK